MKTLQYRIVTMDELDRLCQIEQEHFNTDRLSKRQFKRFIAQGAVWGAFLGEDFVSYCIVLSRRNSLSLRLYSIVVVTQYQGQGIWQSLLDNVIYQLLKTKAFTHLTLEVAKTNQRAIRAYHKYGFVQIGMKPQYYQDGTDALIMRKALQAE